MHNNNTRHEISQHYQHAIHHFQHAKEKMMHPNVRKYLENLTNRVVLSREQAIEWKRQFNQTFPQAEEYLKKQSIDAWLRKNLNAIQARLD